MKKSRSSCCVGWKINLKRAAPAGKSDSRSRPPLQGLALSGSGEISLLKSYSTFVAKRVTDRTSRLGLGPSLTPFGGSYKSAKKEEEEVNPLEARKGKRSSLSSIFLEISSRSN